MTKNNNKNIKEIKQIIRNLEFSKYMHIFWIKSTYFQTNMIKIISNEAYFKPEEHFFVVLYKDMYDSLCTLTDRIVYIPIESTEDVHFTNLLARKCKYQIWHGSCFYKENFLKVKARYLKRIIIRTWGANRLTYYYKSYSSKTYQSIINFRTKKRFSKLACIGVANYVDTLSQYEHNLINKNNLRASYSLPTDYVILLKEKFQKNVNNKCKILLGHSAYYDDNHIEILKTLKKFSKENIHIYIPLTYGSDTYIKEVTDYAKSKFNSKVTIITEHMSFKKYVHFLNKMDVAIIDGTYSYALGNIEILLFLNKKIYLNEQGVLNRAFNECNIPHELTNNLSSCTIKDLAKPVVYRDDTWKKLSIDDENFSNKCWQKIFKKYN